MNAEDARQHLAAMPRFADVVVTHETLQAMQAAGPVVVEGQRYNFSIRDLGLGRFKIRLTEAR